MNPRRAAAAVAAAVTTAALILTSATTATAAPAANGPTSAYKVKTFHRIGKDWEVRVDSIDYSANAACQKADRLTYHKPKKGYVYVVVQYTGKKLKGGKKQNLGDAINTNVKAKSGHGKQYGWDYDIVAPHPAATAKKAGKGQESSGGFTYMVKKSDAKAKHFLALVQGYATSDTGIFWYHT